MSDKCNELQKTIDKQNEFILDLFNDKRIPIQVKKEYEKQYNDLAIKKVDDN